MPQAVPSSGRSFAELTDPSTPLDVPPDWLQGRTVFGGLQAAAALRALEERIDPARAVRSLSVCFVGPTGHEAMAIEPHILREGGTVTHARADVIGSEGVACTLTAAFGKDRASSVAREPQRADVPDEIGGLALPYLPGITPSFVQHFDIRWVSGQPPFTAAEGPLAHEGWCRHRTDPGPVVPALLGLLDAWPSPALQALKGPAPASSVTWSAQLCHVPEAVTPDDAFYFRARVLSAPGSAYVTMRGELYDRAGLLVAHLEQLVTVYG